MAIDSESDRRAAQMTVLPTADNNIAAFDRGAVQMIYYVPSSPSPPGPGGGGVGGASSAGMGMSMNLGFGLR